MKLLNSSGNVENIIRRYVIDCVNDVFSCNTSNPEQEITIEITELLKNFNFSNPKVSVRSNKNVVKVNLSYDRVKMNIRVVL